jgi:YHS domain-containing protein
MCKNHFRKHGPGHAIAKVGGLLAILHVVAALAVLTGIHAFADAGQDQHDTAPAPKAPTGATAKQHDSEQAAETAGDPYPLDFCVVTGEKLGSMGEPIVYNHNGREIKFCCAACIKQFEADPAKYVSKIDAAIVKQQTPHYPLSTCIVAGGKLVGMGKTVDYVYNNRLVRFCCAGCISEFKANAEKYIAEIDAAVIAEQKNNYPLDHCLVLPDEEIGGKETIDYVVANRLFRLCCTGCRDDVKSNAAHWLGMLDKAHAAN